MTITTIKSLQITERFLEIVIKGLEWLRERVAICPACGKNRYTGDACIKYPMN